MIHAEAATRKIRVNFLHKMEQQWEVSYLLPELSALLQAPTSTYEDEYSSRLEHWMSPLDLTSTSASTEIGDSQNCLIRTSDTPEDALLSNEFFRDLTSEKTGRVDAIGPATHVFSISPRGQPKVHTRRKMTEDERSEYRRRRMLGSCERCRRLKRKASL